MLLKYQGDLMRVFPKARSIHFLLAAGILGTAALLGCETDSNSDPTITITSPAEGDTVMKASIVLRFKTTNFSKGHVHVWLDVPDSIRFDANVLTVLTCCTDSVVITDIKAIPVGTHTLAVGGAHEDHSDIEGMEDEVDFYAK
ncbi:MAG TPA: hypothetical protein DCQ83_05985 [Fibrobacteres bacterium]|nr:hypothetical protein [Fibrobacterota bacterium]